jgi:hypothetical protein
MGRIIPAGTGMKYYRNTFVQREQTPVIPETPAIAE